MERGSTERRAIVGTVVVVLVLIVGVLATVHLRPRAKAARPPPASEGAPPELPDTRVHGDVQEGDGLDGMSSGIGDSAPTASKDAGLMDLVVERAVEPDQHLPIGESTASFEVVAVKLKQSNTRFLISLRFRSRQIRGLELDLCLLDDADNVLGSATHAEELGPEELIVEGKNIGKRRAWDDPRAIWFTLPLAANSASMLRLSVRGTR